MRIVVEVRGMLECHWPETARQLGLHQQHPHLVKKRLNSALGDAIALWGMRRTCTQGQPIVGKHSLHRMRQKHCLAVRVDDALHADGVVRDQGCKLHNGVAQRIRQLVLGRHGDGHCCTRGLVHKDRCPSAAIVGDIQRALQIAMDNGPRLHRIARGLGCDGQLAQLGHIAVLTLQVHSTTELQSLLLGYSHTLVDPSVSEPIV